ncbi:MAG: exo-alpha-sialidase [Lentisphaeria bacterium]|nr:exo-alpha-sialidase [Lentisphaeria bacterium]
MSLKGLICAFASLAMVSVFAADPFGTRILDGGKVVPGNLTLVGTTNEHMNFCFANNFPDGTIYMNHSEGIHTVSEYGVWRRSMDGGKTWEKTPFNFGGFNTFVNKEGKKCQVGCWDDKISDTHKIRLQILNDEQTGFTDYYSEIKLPFKSSFRLHREVLRTRDGRLLLNGYLRKENAPKFTSFVIESKDDGKTWTYLATIMEDPQKKYQEGPNETAMVELANGDILAYVRTGGAGPLMQFRSTDGGRTWGEMTEVASVGVNPAARVLENGTLVLITGRPGLFLYIDFTGTGKYYQRYTVWNGSGSSYASVLEIAPNKVLVVYDESDFGSWRNDSCFSRIMAVTYDIVKDDALKAAKITHPEAKNYQNFYSPECRDTLTYRNFFDVFAVQTKEKGASKGVWYEVQKIAERPHPVLHLELKGEEAPFKFAHYLKNLDGAVNELEIGWEIRISDMSINQPQFRILTQMEKNASLVYVACAKDAILVFDGKAQKRVPLNVGEGFNSYKLKTNAATNSIEVYFNGKKVYTGTAHKQSDGICNRIQLGDGSGQIYGAVDLSYLGFNIK